MRRCVGGFAGAREVAETIDAPVEAAIVLGDLASGYVVVPARAAFAAELRAEADRNGVPIVTSIGAPREDAA